MMSAFAAPCCRPPRTPLLETSSVRELSLRRTESLELSFTDPAGRAYQLTVERETSLYSLTYDRLAQVVLPGRSGRGLALGHGKGAGRDDTALGQALRDSDLAVAGFQKLLHRFLKAVDPAYREHFRSFDPVAARVAAVEEAHAELLAVNQTVTVTLAVPEGAPADYWSVEATAGRLRDLAVGLYAGGDRAEHREVMAQAMEQGFREAQGAFGGLLPDLSRQTVDLAQELLARWAEQGAGVHAQALDLVA